jgi:hypothetical protein
MPTKKRSRLNREFPVTKRNLNYPSSLWFSSADTPQDRAAKKAGRRAYRQTDSWHQGQELHEMQDHARYGTVRNVNAKQNIGYNTANVKYYRNGVPGSPTPKVPGEGPTHGEKLAHYFHWTSRNGRGGRGYTK